jgi:hypothetical protein
MKKLNIEQLANNQIIITDDKGNKIFSSYNTVIGIRAKDNKVTLDSKFWNYSKTTSKYRNIFLNETTKETIKKIESKQYTLKDLN